jgi:phosphatidylglycerol:prolipoprotein diacylglycerol transferase
MHPLFHIPFFDITIPAYGLMLSISSIIGYLYARFQLGKHTNLKEYHVDIIILSVIVGSIFGARIFYFLFQTETPLRYLFSHTVVSRSSGLTFYGGFIAGLLLTVIWMKVYKLNFLVVADIFVIPLSLGLGLTRIGCFLAGCCWGKPTQLPWAVTFTNQNALTTSKYIPLHPVQLYHSLTNLVIFLTLVILAKLDRNQRPGKIFIAFLLIYPPMRFILEFFRADEQRGFVMGLLSTSQFVSIFVFITGIVLARWFVLKYTINTNSDFR